MYNDLNILSCLDLQPENYAYYGNRCACYIMMKQFQNALNDARMSLSLNPSFTKGYLREAKCHMALGSPQIAETSLLKALEIDRSNKQAAADVCDLFPLLNVLRPISEGSLKAKNLIITIVNFSET